DHPLAFVSVKPVPGWTVKVNEGKLPEPVTTEHGELTEAVTSVVWSGGEIGQGEFQEFEVSMGRLPTGVDQLVFPAKQTYSSGEVVDWADAPAADGSEPERPAPVLKLTPAADASPAPSASPAAVAATTKAAPADSSDSTARLLGGAGLAVGVIGVVVAVRAPPRRPPCRLPSLRPVRVRTGRSPFLTAPYETKPFLRPLSPRTSPYEAKAFPSGGDVLAGEAGPGDREGQHDVRAERQQPLPQHLRVDRAAQDRVEVEEPGRQQVGRDGIQRGDGPHHLAGDDQHHRAGDRPDRHLGERRDRQPH